MRQASITLGTDPTQADFVSFLFESLDLRGREISQHFTREARQCQRATLSRIAQALWYRYRPLGNSLLGQTKHPAVGGSRETTPPRS